MFSSENAGFLQQLTFVWPPHGRGPQHASPAVGKSIFPMGGVPGRPPGSVMEPRRGYDQPHVAGPLPSHAMIYGKPALAEMHPIQLNELKTSHIYKIKVAEKWRMPTAFDGCSKHQHHYELIANLSPIEQRRQLAGP